MGPQVDLNVPAALGGIGCRAARYDSHRKQSPTKVHGLEGALVSHTLRRVAFWMRVRTGNASQKVVAPVALAVAVLHKIGVRREDHARHRQELLPKDTSDIHRFLPAIGTADPMVEHA